MSDGLPEHIPTSSPLPRIPPALDASPLMPGLAERARVVAAGDTHCFAAPLSSKALSCGGSGRWSEAYALTQQCSHPAGSASSQRGAALLQGHKPRCLPGRELECCLSFPLIPLCQQPVPSEMYMHARSHVCLPSGKRNHIFYVTRPGRHSRLDHLRWFRCSPSVAFCAAWSG